MFSCQITTSAPTTQLISPSHPQEIIGRLSLIYQYLDMLFDNASNDKTT
jgi:hypothetical protein